ncbi:MAG: sensor histidine kinase [Gammaproteobacteria bacterium]
MSSIRLRLLKWLIGPILLINLAGASLIYLLAWLPAQQAFDQGLQGTVVALAARVRATPRGLDIDLPPQAEQVLRTDETDAVYFVVRSDGVVLAGEYDFPALGRSSAGAVDARMRGEAVRLAGRVLQVGSRKVEIGVAKTLRKRQQTRSTIVRALVLLESLLTLALIGLIWLSVTSALRPLARLRADLSGREAADLAPVEPGSVPFELAPVVGAFNELLDKVQTGIRAQQAFLADVAHQLRTPLAGVRLQLEWLAARHPDDADTARSVALMLSSNERMIRQTNQLLALARAEPSRFEKTRLEKLDLSKLVQQTVQYAVEQAGKKEIDIGFDLRPAVVKGDAFLLRDLVDNLIDNAVRYTPAHGTVTVRCHPGSSGVLFEVIDSGPGIAPHLRNRVFQRYVRLDESSAGNGLGLAIVRDVAQAHGAELMLTEGDGGRGLRIGVRFPPVVLRK